ncbi:MAG: hypothetical protein BWK78_00240 [Thiotrichaceae bacterium IS1]|nr:MAG: hypothetical protein BWK78_00240 [Thiotrichaceae bacterium IS1]
MTYEFDIARALMKSEKSRMGIVNPNVFLSVVGIAVGVMVFVLTLAIYDGYVRKMETIIFSFYPQVTIQSTQSLFADNKDEAPKSLFDDDEHENEICQRLCAGPDKVILADKSPVEDTLIRNAGVFKLSDLARIIDKLKSIKGIDSFSPVIFEERRFKYSYLNNDHQEFVREGNLRVLGVQATEDEHYIPEVQRIISNPTMLKLLNQTDKNAVILSAELYRNLFGETPLASEVLNKKLRVQRQDDKKLEGTSLLELEVVGIFRLGIHKIADNMLVTGLPTAQKILDMTNQASMLGISLTNPYRSKEVSDQIQQVLAEEEVMVFHWLLVAEDLFSSLSLYRHLIIVVLLMSIIITAFNIYNNLTIMILERTRQIGMLRAMGVKQNAIYRIFLLISQIEAMTGSLIGIMCGMMVGHWFNEYLNKHLANFLPVQEATINVNSDVIAIIVVAVCLVCALTSLIPAYQANRLDVVEALQTE